MHPLQTHPGRVLGGLLVLAFALFMCSGIPRYKEATSGLDLAIGDVFWFGWMVVFLVFVGCAIYTATRRVRRRRVV